MVRTADKKVGLLPMVEISALDIREVVYVGKIGGTEYSITIHQYNDLPSITIYTPITNLEAMRALEVLFATLKATAVVNCPDRINVIGYLKTKGFTDVVDKRFPYFEIVPSTLKLVKPDKLIRVVSDGAFRGCRFMLTLDVDNFRSTIKERRGKSGRVYRLAVIQSKGGSQLVITTEIKPDPLNPHVSIQAIDNYIKTAYHRYNKRVFNVGDITEAETLGVYTSHKLVEP